MLDTGLIAAQIAFLLLLYLFVWRIVRSSSKSIDPVANQPAERTAPPVVSPVVAQAAPVAPVIAPAPAAPSADLPPAVPSADAPAVEMPAVVRIPPRAQPQPPEPAAAPVPDPIPVEGEDGERHPLLADSRLEPEGESAVDHPPEWEPETESGWTPADEATEASSDDDAQPAEEPAEPEAESAGADDEMPPALSGDGIEPPGGEEVAAAAAPDGAVSRSRARTDAGGVINLDNLAPKLVVEESPAAQVGTEMDLSGGLTIGRSGSNDFTVDDPFVSHMHARILRRGAYYFVEDLGSTNGTFLNDQEVERDARLKVRDTLRIGQTVLRYEE